MAKATSSDTKREAQFNPDEARQMLKEFLTADLDVPETHPLYPLYLQLLAWEERQEELKREYAGKLGADKGISRDEARSILSMGPLDSDDDYMLVHTMQAQRLFMGRGRDPEGRITRIPGAKNVGSALRNLWLLSGQDNPYADWMLILSELELGDLIRNLQRAVSDARSEIKAMEDSGIFLSILRNRNPAKVSLGFRSPYGYMISKLVMEFDMFIRVVKTLTARNLITADRERVMINERARPMRASFDRILRNNNVLQVPAYASLTRADIKNPRSKDTKDRVLALAEIWPGLPAEVLDRSKLPNNAKPLRRAPLREALANEIKTTEEGDLL